MMRLDLLFVPIFIAVGISSCFIQINTSGYEALSAEDKAKVRLCAVPVDSLRADGNIYQITARQLEKYLERHADVIVYEYRSFCTGPDCVSPVVAEQVCRERGYVFCLVAVTYDYLVNSEGVTCPRLVINMDAYGTDNYKKYSRSFFNELIGQPSEDVAGAFHYFHDGRYICTYKSVYDICLRNRGRL